MNTPIKSQEDFLDFLSAHGFPLGVPLRDLIVQYGVQGESSIKFLQFKFPIPGLITHFMTQNQDHVLDRNTVSDLLPPTHFFSYFENKDNDPKLSHEKIVESLIPLFGEPKNSSYSAAWLHWWSFGTATVRVRTLRYGGNWKCVDKVERYTHIYIQTSILSLGSSEEEQAFQNPQIFLIPDGVTLENNEINSKYSPTEQIGFYPEFMSILRDLKQDHGSFLGISSDEKYFLKAKSSVGIIIPRLLVKNFVLEAQEPGRSLPGINLVIEYIDPLSSRNISRWLSLMSVSEDGKGEVELRLLGKRLARWSGTKLINVSRPGY